jgi:hypothetical protein
MGGRLPSGSPGEDPGGGGAWAGAGASQASGRGTHQLYQTNGVGCSNETR